MNADRSDWCQTCSLPHFACTCKPNKSPDPFKPNVRAGALRQALSKIMREGGCAWSRELARKALDADDRRKVVEEVEA